MKNRTWLICPICGGKTRSQIREDTVLISQSLEKENEMDKKSSYLAITAIGGALMEQQVTDKILACNQDTAVYGLVLTGQQAVALAHTRTGALKDTKRIEFNSGIIDKLIMAFCNSPYITNENYEDTLHELIEMFYDFKNDTWDVVSDDELISFMKRAFNGRCHGSLELLSVEALSQLSRHIHSGHSFGTFKYHSEDQHERT